ncbi:hypothetical protein ACH42_06870 [Endozoicomonas sp. (ex Bugula neritina AB1)]|nr:hypothetical protein ACH42_06870 [Endozoicomonas sp. (ex Bugula neritina AB1)]
MTYAIHPFEYLKALELCATRYSVEVPQEENSTAYWDGVGFKLNNHLFTVDIGEISEIIPVPQITPLPGVKQWAKGVANIHGRLIPIVDLGSFFGLPRLSRTNSHRIIVVDQKAVNQKGISVGLLVDEVHGRQHFPTSDHQTAPLTGLPDNITPYTNGCYQQDSRHIVFDIDQLVASDVFLAAASE